MHQGSLSSEEAKAESGINSQNIMTAIKNFRKIHKNNLLDNIRALSGQK